MSIIHAERNRLPSLDWSTATRRVAQHALALAALAATAVAAIGLAGLLRVVSFGGLLEAELIPPLLALLR